MFSILPTMLLAAQPAVLPVVTGDFDHDGRPDRAMVERSAEGGHRLIVRHASGAVSTIDGKVGDPARFRVKLAAPGEVATACADPRASRKACPGDTLPMGDALMFGGGEASGAVALWTGKSFEVVWIAG